MEALVEATSGPPGAQRMCRQKRRRNQESGLTTMEMVIAMALFGIVLVSQAGLHLIALSAGTAADTSTIAANLARARMEELLALPPETSSRVNMPLLAS